MQERNSEKVVSLSVRATKVTANVLKSAVRAYLSAQKNKSPKHSFCSDDESFDALDNTNFDENAEDAFAIDDSEPLDEKIMRKIMIEKLPEAISILNDEEKELIQQIYFNHISDNELSRYYGVNQSTITRRKTRILKKLKNFFEK